MIASAAPTIAPPEADRTAGLKAREGDLAPPALAPLSASAIDLDNSRVHRGCFAMFIAFPPEGKHENGGVASSTPAAELRIPSQIGPIVARKVAYSPLYRKQYFRFADTVAFTLRLGKTWISM